MKLIHSMFILATILYLTGCNGKGAGKDAGAGNDTISVPDTGYTGIKQFMSGQYMVSEVTFKNGIREGLTKTFYQSGKLQMTYWYVNGLRQDSSCWFYQEGQLFRTTPFRNDTVEGIQRQYYRTGELKAELGYSGGYRTPFFREFTKEGKLVGGYPDVVVKTEDNYTKNGSYRIVLELTDKKTDVNFRRGEFINGVYDTTRLNKIRNVGNTGYIELKKAGTRKPSYVGVVAEILTGFGNRLLVYKKIDLPYNDLD